MKKDAEHLVLEGRRAKFSPWRALGLVMVVAGSLGMAACDEGEQTETGDQTTPATPTTPPTN